MTLKVLAKRIAPGQEHLDTKYESDAMRTWYSDGTNAEPNMVFVRCSSKTIEKILGIFRHWNMTSGDDYVWWFPLRGDADRFVAHLMAMEGVTFWQVGKSDSFACAARVPLLGFRHDLTDHSLRRVRDVEQRTELMRKKAWELMRDYGHHQVSVVLYTRPFNLKRLVLQKDVKPIMVIDRDKSDIEKKIFVDKPVFPRGSFDFRREDPIEYHIFADVHDAGVFFSRATNRFSGWVWHFGTNH